MSSKGKKRADAGQGDLAVQGSSKKAKKAEKAADHDDTEDSDGDDDASEVQVEFEHYDPQESDFHALRHFVTRYLDGEPYDSSGLVDLIIKQNTVGTVLKVADEPDPFGFISVLNLDRYKNEPCIGQITRFLNKKCVSSLKPKLREILCAKGTGLVISERIVNLPPSLASPLHEALFDEVCWAIEDEKTAELRQSFEFKHFVIVTQFLRERRGVAETDVASLRPKKKRSKVVDAEPIYLKLEDEVWSANCSFEFSFDCKQVAVLEDEVVDADEANFSRHIKVIVCDANVASKVRAQLKALVGL